MKAFTIKIYKSQSPRSGAVFPTEIPAAKQPLRLRESQSPRSGAVFPTLGNGKEVLPLLSNLSQSPRSGAVFPTG